MGIPLVNKEMYIKKKRLKRVKKGKRGGVVVFLQPLEVCCLCTRSCVAGVVVGFDL